MSKKDLLNPEQLGTDNKTIWYHLVKYTVFLTPPIGIFLFAYYITRSIALSIIATIAIIITFLIGVALWYIKQQRNGVVIEKE